MSDLERAVHAVIADCLAVAEGESVLVVANPATIGIGERLRGEAARAGADAVLALMHERGSHGAEPPAPVAAAMAAADVVIAPTMQSLSHTAARRAATEAGARVATMPTVTEDILARVMSADFELLRRRCAAVAAVLDSGTEARITCANGSDLRLDLGGRSGLPDDGDLSARGAMGNLPCGEGFISPSQEAGDGKLVVDGTIAGIGAVDAPVEISVEGGRMVSGSGEQGEQLLALLSEHGPEATTVAELGIGTNERATLTGNVLEDEKILGTCHVAFGASKSIGGTIQVPVHLDCVVTRPTVEIDGQTLLRDGELTVEV